MGTMDRKCRYDVMMGRGFGCRMIRYRGCWGNLTDVYRAFTIMLNCR